MKKQSNFSFLLEMAGKEKYKLYLSAFLSAISSALGIVPYILIYNLVLELIKADINIKKVSYIAMLTAISIILKMITLIVSGAFSHIAAFNTLYNIRIKTTEHIAKLNLGFFKEKNIGEIKKILNEDVEKLELFLAHQIPDLSAAIFTPLIIFIFLLFLNWKIALVLLIPISLAIIAQMIMFKNYGERMEEYNNIISKLHSTITEYIRGMNVFKAFNLTARSFKKYVEVNENYTKVWHKITDSYGFPYAIFLVVLDSSLLFMIPSAGYFYLKNFINLPTFLLFVLLGSSFLQSLKSLISFAEYFSFVLTSLENIQEIMQKPVQSSHKDLKNINFNSDIEFKNVNFKYNKKNVLNNINLTFKKNTITALVGPSGSGKTTIAYLLGRFWDINEGEILIDNKNIKDISVDILLSNIAYVFQDIFILSDSIFENIKMGLDKTKEEIYEAAKKAEIHDFIMSLPQAYDTQIGDGAIKLSGGEKQRIAIARCILKNSPIIILDEITSYSDVENEVKIQKAIRNLLKNKTAIIIAHRLYTIKDVDNIVVLNEGNIVESGKHQELLKNENSLYKHLWEVR